MTPEQLIKFMQEAEARQIAAIAELKAMIEGTNAKLETVATKIEAMAAEQKAKEEAYMAEFGNA